MQLKRCKVSDCTKDYYSKELCKVHYDRFRRRGTLEERVCQNNSKCSAVNCTENAEAKGFCHTHYTKVRRTGTLERLVFGPEWKEKQRQAHLSELGKMDPSKGPHTRGTYSVNVVNDVKYKAVQRGKEWSLTNEECFKLITSPCYYCSYEPNWPNKRVGIDRLDNNKGYNLENTVSCCFSCNSAKGTKTVKEFIEWITLLTSNLDRLKKVSNH